jgi:high-affinity nickel permease
LDQLIAGRGVGGSLPVVLIVALVLGLRHASDPDHLVAVSTLVATERERTVRRAGTLGLAWGLGHATLLSLLGIPIVLADLSLPASIERFAELLIGLVIAALAVRLLARWRAGSFHAHEHAHGDLVHRHLHGHGGEFAPEHAHAHVVRSPLQAYAIGTVHGLAGSAAVTILLVAAIGSRSVAVAALLVFAAGTAISMALASAAFGYALGREPLRRRFVRIAPGIAVAAFAFGIWYGVQAVV